MKRIRAARELYCEILKSFYFGVYTKEGRFMTYQELHETYCLSKDTIGRAYAMLRRDGFIRTDGTNGTIVTFDRHNPEHVAKVPLEWPRPDAEDTASYKIVMRLHESTLYAGLRCANGEQLLEFQKLTEEIIESLRNGRSYFAQVFQLWLCMVSVLDNKFLNRITDHFLNRYLYFVPQRYLPIEQCSALLAGAREFYEYLLDAINRRDFGAYPEQLKRHHNNYIRLGGMVFSKLEERTLFNEQTLYERLLDDLCVGITVGDLRKGDTLPTTVQLCKEYGVSKTTANRAYSILAEMGLIDRQVRSGTRLIAEPGDPEIRKALDEVARFYWQDWKDAKGALMVISDMLDKYVSISKEVERQMEAELARQRELFDRYRMPFSVSAVLVSPLVASLPVGILHKYYDYLTDTLSKMVSLCTLRAKGTWNHGEEIYQRMCAALDALKRGDQTSFAELSRQAMRRNVELLTEDFIEGQSLTGNPTL